MTWHSILYNVLLLGVCVYAIGWGRWPERTGTIVWVANNILTAVALAHSKAMFVVPELGVFAVDGVTFLIFVALALSADRRWPMFAAGMIGCELLIHVGKIAQPAMLPFGYGIGLLVWGYAVILSIGLGTWRSRRQAHPTRRSAASFGY